MKSKIGIVRQKEQEGAALLIVVMLVVLFSGLGLLAVRNTGSEMRAASAFKDRIQAALLAETAIGMLATDLRLYWDFPNISSGCRNWKGQFAEYRDNGQTSDLMLNFSDVFVTDGSICEDNLVPHPNMNGGSVAETAVLGGPTARVTIRHRMPVDTEAETGYSNEDSGNPTVRFYRFMTRIQATYGVDNSFGNAMFARAQATARGEITVGPL
jgi:PilX N-terminal